MADQASPIAFFLTLHQMRRLLPLLLAAALFAACGDGQQQPTPEGPDFTAVATPTFCADSAYQYVARQLHFGVRAPGSKGHQQCAQYLASAMRQWCDTVVVQEFTAVLWNGDTYRGQNIICSLDPAKSERVLLGAHWDSRLWADHDASEANHRKPIMGANDGASGVGTLMEMARVMSGQRPRVGVDIVFFDMEDQGTPEWADSDASDAWCLGSQYWARNPHRPFYNARYGILLDMVGTRQPRYTREEFSRHYAPGIVEKLWRAASQMGHGNVFVERDTDPILDDHLYVNRLANIPMVDIVQNSDGCSFFPYWHTLEDDLSCIDAQSLKTTADVVLKVIYQ